MHDIICPLDGKTCEQSCPDRYHDKADGGCFLTAAREQGGTILALGGDTVGVLFTPGRGWRTP